MDEITKAFLYNLAASHRGYAIHLTHQFLDGIEGRACGFVPTKWNGHRILLRGQWWA